MWVKFWRQYCQCSRCQFMRMAVFNLTAATSGTSCSPTTLDSYLGKELEKNMILNKLESKSLVAGTTVHQYLNFSKTLDALSLSHRAELATR